MPSDGRIRTDDGVEIHHRSTGAGDPVVLVHGGATDSGCFDAVADVLAGSCEVVTYDRRGHGLSGEGADHSLAREGLDLRAVIEATAPARPVAVVGYSYGAVVSLMALGGSPDPVRAMVAYEPPFSHDGLLDGWPPVLALLEEGRPDEALDLFVRSTFHLPEAVVAAMRRDPRWQASLRAVGNLRFELANIAATHVGDVRSPLAPLRVLAAGSGGNPAFREIARELVARVPDADLVDVPGLPHFAMATDPEPFAAAVTEHLERAAAAA